ncbi:MAG: AMP-dependent synthetase and ligase [Frankiales bacterium]|nr:AMP-dependent synthetase and ligase [Frankiales bacterium]
MTTATPAGSTVGTFHLGRLAEDHLARVGDSQALLFEGSWFTTTQLFSRAERVAGGLREIGVQAGDRVVVLMMNTPEVGITYQALWRAGAVVTPVLFLISPDELRHILVDSEAVAVVVTPELLPLLQPAAAGLDQLKVLLVGDAPEGSTGTTPYAELEQAAPAPVTPRDDDDMAALLYTGGTTGRSKGVMLSHRGLWASGSGLHENSRAMTAVRGILPLPLSHAYGLIVTIGGMHAEEPRLSVLQRWFNAEDWVRLVEEHRLESSSVVPSMLTMLLALPLEQHDLSSLKYFGSGGAPLSPALRQEVMDRLGVEIFEGYGCTESSAVISASAPGANRPGSVGKPLPHAEVAILDDAGQPVPTGEDGEVCVRGAGVMKGYWKAEQQTAETIVGGFLHTGDIGHLDDDGFLYIVDRKKDLIIRGGFNVFPRDVEDVLLDHPDVVQAAVVGRPDEAHGEEVVAFVALRAGAEVTGEQLVAFSKEHLSKYKYPREVHVLPQVPLTSVGKTDRKAVRALVRE